MRSLVVCPYLPDAADHGGRIRTRVFLKALVRLGPVEVGAPFPGEDGRERADRLAAELGVEVFEDADVGEATERLKAAGLDHLVEDQTTCCYAKQNKVWAREPDGLRWEWYRVLDDTDAFGRPAPPVEEASEVE